jgi:hypothetical protein
MTKLIWIFFQLTVTTAFIAVFCFTPAIKNFYCVRYGINSAGNEQVTI